MLAPAYISQLALTLIGALTAALPQPAAPAACPAPATPDKGASLDEQIAAILPTARRTASCGALAHQSDGGQARGPGRASRSSCGSWWGTRKAVRETTANGAGCSRSKMNRVISRLTEDFIPVTRTRRTCSGGARPRRHSTWRSSSAPRARRCAGSAPQR